jgi:putative membrane protein
MGASKAKNPDVKKFGQKMADDHALMLKDLQTLAKSKGVALPTTVNARDFAEMKKLEHASGDDFDRKYMQEMVKDHEKHVKNTETLAAKAKDPDFKSAVQHASAKIREHLQHAKSIADSRALSPK